VAQPNPFKNLILINLNLSFSGQVVLIRGKIFLNDFVIISFEEDLALRLNELEFPSLKDDL
jgi:hypothetical protein